LSEKAREVYVEIPCENVGEALRDRIHKSSDEELGQVLIQLKTILGYASTHPRASA